jgi:thioredoxin reductase (NADPH)
MRQQEMRMRMRSVWAMMAAPSGGKTMTSSESTGTGITLYGAHWCPDCRRSKAFLSDQRIAYTYVDIEEHPDAIEIVNELNDGKQIIPTIVFPDGSHVAEPTNEELAEKLGLAREAANDTYDLVIVGGGPTGLTTAIYAARENLRTLVVERSALGGQAGITERLDNYPGFPEGIKGADLAERFVQQAQRYEVELLPAVSVSTVAPESGAATVTLSTGQQVMAGAVLIATGSTYRRTNAPGEADLIGSGVHFCATCDGPFYKGAGELVVLGGGNSGLEEGLFLTQFADHVTVVERGDQLAGSRLLQDKVANHPRMSVLTGQSVVGFEATPEDKLAAVLLDGGDGQVNRHEAAAAFVFIGLKPNTGWLDGLVALDEAGFIVTDRMMGTSQRGVFAAGDVRAGSTKQLASAVGEGAAVALQIRYHLDGQRG